VFTAEFTSERILKSDQHLAKLWAGVGRAVLLIHGGSVPQMHVCSPKVQLELIMLIVIQCDFR